MTRSPRATLPTPLLYSRHMRTKLTAALSLCALAALAGCDAMPDAAAQPPAGRPTTARTPRVVRLAPAEATRLARQARRDASVRLAPGLELTAWAPERLVTDPIAIDVDGRGVVYVTSSGRSGGLLDIRRHPAWVADVHTLTSVDALRAFYRRELAPARSAQNAWIPDLNKDGSRDWRDVTLPAERVHRIMDRSGDGLADFSQIMIEGFNEDPVNDVAGGVLAVGGDLLVAAAPDVWRLRDANGDGTVDSRRSISHGYNVHPAFFGHGLAGLTMGPDGRVYWSVGDMGFNVADSAGRRWALQNQGAIVRANPDGTDFEVFAAGLRNPQAFAFDEYGDLVAADNDGDHPGETERIVYVTHGSDAGWRSTWQYGKYTDPANNRYNVWMDEGLFRPRFAGQAAYITPPVAAYHSGPAGMVYNPGTALGERWRGHYFVSSFVGAPGNARIFAFRLDRQGAGFALASDTAVVQGILTVGMRFGPEGALYLADWIDGWDSKGKGRIWKLDAPEAAASPLRREVRALLAEPFAPQAADRLRALLGHADMRVRQQAQHELARRADTATLLAAARADDRQLARVHALWGLGQLARADARHAAALVPFLRDADAEVRAQAAKMLGDARHAAAGDSLVPLLGDAAPRARLFAAEALGRVAHAPAVPALVAMLAENDDRDVHLRQAGVTALARIGRPAPVAALSAHASRGVRLAAVVALRRMRSPEVARFLDDGDEAVVTEAARAINDEGGIEAARPALARVLERGRAAGAPLVRRAIAAGQRLGTPEALARVAAFAERAGAPDTLRAEAIAALGTWPKPSPFDRVDGAWLGPAAPRDPAPARAAVARLAGPMLRGGSAPLMLATVNAVAALGLTEVSPLLLAALRSDAPAPVRVAALRALQAVGADEVEAGVRAALADTAAALRTAGLGLVPALRLSDAATAELLATVLERGSPAEQQSAIASLGRLRSAEARQALGRLLDRLTAGTLAPEVRLDVVEAAQASGAPALAARVRRHTAARTGEALLATYGEALHRGGSAARGREVVFQNAAGQCTRCHAVGGPGADVGPDLSRVGAALSREQLLEALVAPSARLAPGYGIVMLTLRDGRRVQGMLRGETAGELVVEGAPGRRERVAKRNVAQRTNAPSPMPPMGGILRPREIRDVVEYLSTLR